MSDTTIHIGDAVEVKALGGPVYGIATAMEPDRVQVFEPGGNQAWWETMPVRFVWPAGWFKQWQLRKLKQQLKEQGILK